ncbi:MAG: hypothetical protein HY271_12575 [Deltaproteobacteria bacterium]|nr:hypothetical protein [Deltaproteobacteria bacterium]
MRLVPTLAVLLVTHGLFFHDVIFDERSLSPATYTSGLTPTGPYGAPASAAAPHLLDVEGAAWVDEPSPYLAAAGWRAGEPPLWTAAEGLGAPLAANLNSGAANPLHLPLALWPGPRGFDLFALARLLLLALGTVLFLDALTLAPVAALTGAVVTAYGGYAMAWIVHHPLSAEVFLPLMLAGLERGRRGARGGWTLLALASAGSLVGGKLQASLLCFALVAAYAVVRAPRFGGGAGAATRLATFVALGLGIGLAAYLLVPAAELMARASGLTLGGRSALAGLTLPWPTLAAVALPRLFVPPGRVFAEGLPLPPAIGVVATMLAVLGVVAGRSPLRGVARFFALWSALVLLRNAGLFGHEWMTAVPVVRGIFFLKYTFTAAFGLAVVAAIGLDAVAHGLVRPPAWPGGRRLGAAPTAILLAASVVFELRLLAPAVHPPRLDPYRPPPYVEFLRAAPRGRILAADALMPPLTSAAAGLRDLRAIDVLTPGTTYAFFTRLVSFCSRIIHFTVDPDLPVAATAPAIDLAGVRWIVARGALDLHDLDTRVDRQIGHERLARLLSGLRAIRAEGADLALGTVESGGERRFALSLLTPFALELEAESEAPELAWDLHVESDAARLTWSIEVPPAGGDGATATSPPPAGGTERDDASAAAGSRSTAIDADATPGWRPTHVALGAPGVRRRVRLRLEGASAGAGRRARVDFGDLGFSEGTDAEAARRAVAVTRHRAEVSALVPVFHDAAVDVVVYENRNALPRAFRVTRREPVASVEAALTRLADGFDFRAAALVTAPAAVGLAAERVATAMQQQDAATRAHGDGLLGASAWSGATIVVKDDPETIAIATDGAETALVVLGDLDYPGWRATIDGRPTPILTADGVLRGVLVPPGPHCLEYRYLPASWGWGIVVTALAAALLPSCARRAARMHGKIVPAFARVV